MNPSTYASLPPTCNNLDGQQRSRLIRSTRKLGALLGTTPHLIEIDSSARAPISLSLPTTKPKSKYSRGDGSILLPLTSSESLYSGSTSTNSSVTSLGLPSPRTSLEAIPTPTSKSVFSKARRSADAPRPLMLRLNPVAVPSSDPRIAPNSPDTVLAPTFRRSSVINVSTPTSPVLHSEAEARRRKMAKLTRTLGENVPPELVFAAQHPDSPAVKQEVVLPPSLKRSSKVWETGAAAWRGEWNRKDIREVQNQLRNLKAR